MTPAHDTQHEYRYTPRWGVMLLTACFFGVCGIVLAGAAKSNSQGMIINGIIELSAANATLFYWVLTALSFGFVALAALMLFIRVCHPQAVVLADDGLHAPKRAWSRAPMFIAYQDVLELSSFAVNGQRFLKVVYAGGKLTLTASLFESIDAFEGFCIEFARRVP